MNYKYSLRDGMVLTKHFEGRSYELVVVKSSEDSIRKHVRYGMQRRKRGEFQFKLGDRLFDSLTAAAKFVCGQDRSVSGPEFWSAPKA